jgi:hypothetical protein
MLTSSPDTRSSECCSSWSAIFSPLEGLSSSLSLPTPLTPFFPFPKLQTPFSLPRLEQVGENVARIFQTRTVFRSSNTQIPRQTNHSFGGWKVTCARMRLTMRCSKKFINQMQRIPATKKISSQLCSAGYLKQRPSIRVRPTSSSHVNLRSRSDHPPSLVVQYARSGNVPQAMQLLHRTRSAIENRRARHRLIASGC